MWVNISKYLFKLYIIWSVCADIVLIAGIVALLFGDIIACPSDVVGMEIN
jgi:hypothetical protein